MDKEVEKSDANKSSIKNQTLLLTSSKPVGNSSSVVIPAGHSSTWKLLQKQGKQSSTFTETLKQQKDLVTATTMTTYNNVSKSLMKLLFGNEASIPQSRPPFPTLMRVSSLEKPQVKPQSLTGTKTLGSFGSTVLPRALEDFDVQRRLRKMSWGDNESGDKKATTNPSKITAGGSSGSGSSSGHSGGGSNGGSSYQRCPPPPRIKSGGAGLGRALIQATWFFAKLAVVTSLCVWTAEEGLWGSYDETREFHAKLDSLFNKLPSYLESNEKK